MNELIVIIDIYIKQDIETTLSYRDTVHVLLSILTINGFGALTC